MSLRWKLALAMVLVSTLATAAFGVASYRSTEQRLLAEVDQSLVDLEPTVVASGADTIAVGSGGLLQYPAQFIAPDGTVLRSTFPEPIAGVAARSTAAFETVSTSDGKYRVRVVTLPRGVMVVGRPLAETERVLDGVKRRTVLLLALVAAVAAALGVLLADRITAPLRRLTAAADDVARSGRPAHGVALVTEPASGDEVGRLSAGFGRMLQALARSQEEQERLVQDAGHELRTPLTSLRTNLDVLARYPDITPEQRGAIVADLQAEVGELAELVDEIVAVAGGGLAAGAGSEQPSEFDLTELARSVAERYARRTGREVTVVGDAVSVVAERTGVQRALSCLIDNACKFDPTGSPVEVTVGWAEAATDPDDATARVADVRVRDHGPGIADTELGLVFDRFHRATEARTLPGSGLGLAIVRAVAERHGGTAGAVNHPDGGAIVGFTLAGAPQPQT